MVHQYQHDGRKPKRQRYAVQLIVTNHLSSWRFLCANFTGCGPACRNIDIRFAACTTYIFNAQAATPFPPGVFLLPSRGLACIQQLGAPNPRTRKSNTVPGRTRTYKIYGCPDVYSNQAPQDECIPDYLGRRIETNVQNMVNYLYSIHQYITSSLLPTIRYQPLGAFLPTTGCFSSKYKVPFLLGYLLSYS